MASNVKCLLRTPGGKIWYGTYLDEKHDGLPGHVSLSYARELSIVGFVDINLLPDLAIRPELYMAAPERSHLNIKFSASVPKAFFRIDEVVFCSSAAIEYLDSKK